jgi:hypothetical protein
MIVFSGTPLKIHKSYTPSITNKGVNTVKKDIKVQAIDEEVAGKISQWFTYSRFQTINN